MRDFRVLNNKHAECVIQFYDWFGFFYIINNSP